MVGNERKGWFDIFDLDSQRAIGTTGFQLFRTGTPIPCSAQPRLEALREKGKDVKDRGLSATVRSEQNCQRSQILELNLTKRTEILDLEISDSGRSLRFRCLYGRSAFGTHDSSARSGLKLSE